MSPQSASLLTIRLFGSFEALRHGLPLPGLHIREGERLLAYLTLRSGEEVEARELAERFWPAEARGNLIGQNDFPSLRQALYSLRKALGADGKRLTRPAKTKVHFDVSGVETDILAFDRLSRLETNEDAAWEDAVALYRGPVLEGWSEGWAAEARRQRRRALEQLLRRLAQAAEGEQAEVWLRRLLLSRPEDEAAVRDLMRLLGRRGQYAGITEAQEAVTEALQSAGRSPEPETLALIAALRAEREQRPSSPPLAQAAPPAAPIAEIFAATGGTALPKRLGGASGAIEPEFSLEPAGGAVPVGSPFYMERPADAEFAQAMARHDSIILIKGARQVGKTSLLAQGLQRARQSGLRVAITDFQNFNAAQFATPDALLFALANALAAQLELDVLPREIWDADSGPNMNLSQYLRRHALRAVSGSLVWALDEVDRLFGCPFGSEVFGLFRSWHNARALDPESPWSRLTLVIAYSTEASLFITDLNQSPFNVGTRLALQDFTLEQTALLNARYGSPLDGEALPRFYDLVGGQPYLARRGLDELALGRTTAAQLEADSVRDDGPFGEHLRRLLAVLSRSPELLDVVKALLAGKPCESPDAFFRLRTAGVLGGASCQEARLRCRLYAEYLARSLM